MTIKEVSEQYGLSADTLRYYERVGVIPTVTRTTSGIRDYQEEDLAWVENAVCLRDAGVPVEMLIEYVQMSQQGDLSWESRRALLAEARESVLAAQRKYDIALARLNYKIAMYDRASETGDLIWDDKEYRRLGGDDAGSDKKN